MNYFIPNPASGKKNSGNSQSHYSTLIANESRTGEVFRGWAFEPLPDHHPHDFAIWNLPHGYFLGAFGAAECDRLRTILRPADRLPEHKAVWPILEMSWDFITGTMRGVA